MDALVELPEPGPERTDEPRPQAPIWAEPRHLFFFRLGTLIDEEHPRPIEIGTASV